MVTIIPYLFSEGIILLLYFLADVNFDNQQGNQNQSLHSGKVIPHHDESIEMSVITQVGQYNEYDEGDVTDY